MIAAEMTLSDGRSLTVRSRLPWERRGKLDVVAWVSYRRDVAGQEWCSDRAPRSPFIPPAVGYFTRASGSASVSAFDNRRPHGMSLAGVT
jgi:hypothetical protein